MRWLLLLLAVLGYALGFAAVARPAHAHIDPVTLADYTTLKHPKTGSSCCNGKDCGSIAWSRVREVRGGHLVTHVSGKQTFVPHDETIESADEYYHACFYPNPETLRCFVAPKRTQ